MHSNLLIWLFPVVFMIHEFEEIMLRKWWLRKYRNLITERFPKWGTRMIQKQEALSTEAFSLIVLEEFLIVSGITMYSLYTRHIELFIAMVLAYTAHLLVHIVQTLVLGRYTPAIVTCIITGIYSIYILDHFLVAPVNLISVAVYTIIFIVAVILNLLFMHRMAAKLKILKP